MNDLFVHGVHHVLIRTMIYITGKLAHIYMHLHLPFHSSFAHSKPLELLEERASLIQHV